MLSNLCLKLQVCWSLSEVSNYPNISAVRSSITFTMGGLHLHSCKTVFVQGKLELGTFDDIKLMVGQYMNEDH